MHEIKDISEVDKSTLGPEPLSSEHLALFNSRTVSNFILKETGLLPLEAWSAADLPKANVDLPQSTNSLFPDAESHNQVEPLMDYLTVLDNPATKDLAMRATSANRRKSEYVMICAGEKTYTQFCQDHKHGYYCSSYGELKQQKTSTHTNPICDDMCVCHDTTPVARCDLEWSGLAVCAQKRDLNNFELSITPEVQKAGTTTEDERGFENKDIWLAEEVEQFSEKRSLSQADLVTTTSPIKDEPSPVLKQGPAYKPNRRKSEFAMVCGDSKNATMACMDDKHKYYCTSLGVLKQQSTATHNNAWCLSKCNCIDMNPIAQCRIGWDMTTTCLKKRAELLQYFDDEPGFDDFVTKYISDERAGELPLVIGKSPEKFALRVNRKHISQSSSTLHSLGQILRSTGDDTKKLFGMITTLSFNTSNDSPSTTTTARYPLSEAHIRSSSATMAKPSILYLCIGFLLVAVVTCTPSSLTSNEQLVNLEQGRYAASSAEAAEIDLFDSADSISNATDAKYGARGKTTWAMSCYEDREKTSICQGGDYQYYCNGQGRLQRKGEFGNIFCDDHCWCIDLEPKPSCAWLGFGITEVLWFVAEASCSVPWRQLARSSNEAEAYQPMQVSPIDRS